MNKSSFHRVVNLLIILILITTLFPFPITAANSPPVSNIGPQSFANVNHRSRYPAAPAAPPQPLALTISTDTTWSSTQNLTQDVVITSGAVLTVTAGTDVSIACNDASPYGGGYDPARIEIIVVDGELRADGANFHGAVGNPSCWFGIQYRSGTGGYLLNNQIQDGVVGVMIDGSSPKITYNTISNMQGPNGAAPGSSGDNGIGMVSTLLTWAPRPSLRIIPSSVFSAVLALLGRPVRPASTPVAT
ncbi:MAG: hypothetical protein U9Q70_00755, partial [Chloroflexota bacterium]|nr:hypothetical protein [Chloroflexota bacterium]